MNRKQRRAEKKKPHDPAYMVRNSEMRSHIDKMLKSDPNVRRAIQEEVRLTYLAEAKKQDKDILTLFLMTLYQSEGFGHTRLMRVAKNLSVLQDYYEGKYAEGDMFAMRQHLKERTGIDIDHIEEEVKTIENSNER